MVFASQLLRCQALHHELARMMGLGDRCGYLCHRHGWSPTSYLHPGILHLTYLSSQHSYLVSSHYRLPIVILCTPYVSRVTYGIDYEESFTHIANMATIHNFIVVVVAKGWYMHQMDVKNAFLHGELQQEVYVEQPPGYVDALVTQMMYVGFIRLCMG